jgi:hypothetical protein
MAATAVEDYVTALAGVIDALAVELSQLENAVEQQAADAELHGVRIGADGRATGYSGPDGLQWAIAYEQVLGQALAEATAAREAAAQQLSAYVAQVANANPHPNAADATTLFGLLADLTATPTAARREVKDKLRKLTGEELKLKEEIAEEKSSGKSAQQTLEESAKVRKELVEVKEELKSTGRLESRISKLLDTRASNVRDFMRGKEGEGRHVGGNTPDALKAAADGGEPGALDKLLKFGDAIPVVDIATALAGTVVSTYDDVHGGKAPGTALAQEAVANAAGTAAGSAAGAAAGAEVGAALGSTLGSAAGPAGTVAGVVAGAVVGYAAGDVVHNLEVEPWTQERQQYGVVLGTLYGEGHAEAATVDDARELAVGIGHDVESVWDDL